VVIDNLGIERIWLLPTEAQAPLVVDSNRVLTFSVSLESF